MSGLAPGTAIASTVAMAATGDQAAFARVAAAFQPDMLRVAYVVCADWSLAEEATEAALWIAWRKLHSLRDPERVKPWLVAIAANEARGLLRSRSRRTVVELSVAQESDAAADPSGGIAVIDLANALGRLRPDDRKLIALRYVAGLESAEIGPLVGMSASGVRTRLSRLLDRLRTELDHG